MARKTRTAAQKAATRKLVALNKARARGAAPARRRSNPIKRRRMSYGPPVPVTRGRKRPIRRRRNPIAAKGVMTLVQDAIPGAVGAVALDALWANLPLPETLKSGYVGYAVKGAGAVGLAILARRVVSKRTADAMGVGALTVMMHGAGKQLLGQMVPGLNLGCDTGYSGMGYYPQNGLGYYPAENLGYINPAVPVSAPENEMAVVR